MKMRTLKTTKFFALIVAFALLVSVFPMMGGSVAASVKSSDAGKEKVSVELKQTPGSKDRVDVIVQSAASWDGSLDKVIKENGGNVKRIYKTLNARAVKLPASAVASLAKRNDVSYISPDRSVEKLGHVTLTTGADAARTMGGSTAYDGTGVGIAILDSGIDANHLSSTYETNSNSRIAASVDFTGEGRTDDPFGHGTHVAGIAAGNGQIAQGSYRGIAPNARIINLRVLNSQGSGKVSDLLAAIDWIKLNRTAHNIRVVNMSLGTSAVDSYKYDPLCVAVRSLVNLGVVVVAAAGNEGKDSKGTKVYGRIHSPGVDPSVITVGATNTFGTDTRADDAVTTYSSRGPTRSFWTDGAGTRHYDNLVKPDLVAPGNKIVSATAYKNYLVTNNPSLDANVSGSYPRKQMYMSGTSMATPVVAGAAAMLMQANPTLTPNLVKMILMYTAQQLPGFNTFEQGAGQVNIEGAMRLARLVRTDLNANTALGSSLLTSAAPTPRTTIANHTFGWGQGIVIAQSFATGVSLITKYHKIYGLGVVMTDGTVDAYGVLVSDSKLIASGVTISESILVSNGSMMSDGSPFLGCGSLLSDGVMLADGSLLPDGVVLSDGALISDGVILGDVIAQSKLALLHGDHTVGMVIVGDASIGINPF